MVDVSNTKGGAVMISVQPVSSELATSKENSNPEESWAVVDGDDHSVKVYIRDETQSIVYKVVNHNLSFSLRTIHSMVLYFLVYFCLYVIIGSIDSTNH